MEVERPLHPGVTPPSPVKANSFPKLVSLGKGAPSTVAPSRGNVVLTLGLLGKEALHLLDLGVPGHLLPSHVRLLFPGLS